MNQRPTPIFLPSSPSSNSPMEQLGRLGYGFSLLEEQVQLVLLSERICAGPIQTGDVLGGGGGPGGEFSGVAVEVVEYLDLLLELSDVFHGEVQHVGGVRLLQEMEGGIRVGS